MTNSAEDTEEMQKSTSFWNSFQELEDEVMLEGDPTIKSITTNLVRRKNLQRGITCSEADLNKISAHPAMRMFTAADLRLEFELKAIPFWREWDVFEHLLRSAPTSATYIGLANTILYTYGEEGLDRIQELEELFKGNPSVKLSLDLLVLMCKASKDPKHIEEEQLLHMRKQVEVALFDYQAYFLQQYVFHSYNAFIDTTRLVPTTFIKVYQGREYQAFCEYWREIVLTNQACNKIKVKFTHSSGIEENQTQDADGLHNSWLTNCWK